MTVIVDIPQSGVYVQRGAVFQIIAQLLDLSTGLPVQLQTATGLSITVLYPDGITTQTFVAALFTDGSDGMIYYTTKNDGVTIDLAQIGLYRFQGNGVIGGISLPPSYQSDFYALPNVIGGTNVNITTPQGVVLFDSNNVRWVGTVSPSGGPLSWAAMISGPATFLQFSNLIMRDDLGIYWTVKISTLGVITATQSGNFSGSIDFFTLADVNFKTWIIKISRLGVLTPS